MNSVFLAALGIGGSTLIGTSCGFLLNRISDVWNDIVTAFAAGVMLAAAVLGLFVPALEIGNAAFLISGTLLGVLFLRGIRVFSSRLGSESLRQDPGLMFVLAIALHKFPEGMAGGISLSSMTSNAAFTMVIGLALQNLPEGVVMIPPLLAAGIRRSRAACIALLTGILNAAGVFAGALWGNLSSHFLPLALSFAGGAMLDVIISQMLPQISASHRLRSGSLIVLSGFILMLYINTLC